MRIHPIILLIAFFLFSVDANSADLKVPHYGISGSFTKLKPRIRIYIGTTRPQCSGRINICDIILLGRDSKPGDQELLGTWDTGPGNDQFILEINISSDISLVTLRELINSGGFLITQEFMITPELALQVGYQGDLRIKPGLYQAEQKGDLLYICFNR